MPNCPPVDWTIHVESLYGDSVDRVVALPGGDVLISGRSSSGGIRLGTGPDDIVDHVATSGRTVARLDADGRARWAHAVGSGAANAAEIGVGPRSVWIAGNQGEGVLTVDLEPVAGVPTNEGRDDGFAVQFDLSTGRPGRAVVVGGPERQWASSAVEDGAGNVYATGTYSGGPLDLGEGFSLPGPAPLMGDWAWLASWDRAGRVRWLVGAKWSQGLGLAWKSDTLFWNLLGGDHGWIRPGGGPPVPFERPASPMAEVIYPVDPATGTVRPSRLELDVPNASWDELGLDSAGDVTATGWVVGLGTWVDADGMRHEIGVHPTGSVGTQLTLTADGQIGALDVVPGSYGFGGDVASRAFASSQTHADGVVLNEGTPWAFRLDPNGLADGMAGWRRPDGIVECAWAFGGTPRDAVRDEAGGFVVVGDFPRPMEVRDRDDQVVATFDRSVTAGADDGFVIRFAWPDE